jgi:hypothetical protein
MEQFLEKAVLQITSLHFLVMRLKTLEQGFLVLRPHLSPLKYALIKDASFCEVIVQKYCLAHQVFPTLRTPLSVIVK